VIRTLALFLLAAATALPAGLTTIDTAGYQKLVASHKGKVVLVNFWATYCVPCRKEMPALVQLGEKYRAKGFVFLTVSADEPEDVTRAGNFLAATKVAPPHYVRQAPDDEAFINAIESKWSGALPASFLYGRDGKKLRTFIGEADLKTLEAAIVQALR
jgi:thiol-disulfide isomerase/thioredoxin